MTVLSVGFKTGGRTIGFWRRGMFSGGMECFRGNSGTLGGTGSGRLAMVESTQAQRPVYHATLGLRVTKKSLESIKEDLRVTKKSDRLESNKEDLRYQQVS